MNEIKEHEIIDHGPDNCQYFQGCGVCGTEFTDVATGCGASQREALDDALDQLACNDWDVEPLGIDIDGVNSTSVCQLIQCDALEKDDDEKDDACSCCEMYYYLSIRVK